MKMKFSNPSSLLAAAAILVEQTNAHIFPRRPRVLSGKFPPSNEQQAFVMNDSSMSMPSSDADTPVAEPTDTPSTTWPTYSPISTDTALLSQTQESLSETDESQDATPQEFDAVIVGAGWAGINAARTLLDSGVSSILVLEANDYVGGRSKSINSDGSINVAKNAGNFSNVPVEWGSEWQYVNGNDMEDYLRENGFLQGVDLYSEQDDFLPIKHAQFYMQSIGADGSTNTEVMEDTEVNEVRERVWEGFLDYRKDTKDDQSYFSE